VRNCRRVEFGALERTRRCLRRAISAVQPKASCHIRQSRRRALILEVNFVMGVSAGEIYGDRRINRAERQSGFIRLGVL
jgi:hypothetical protein